MNESVRRALTLSAIAIFVCAAGCSTTKTAKKEGGQGSSVAVSSGTAGEAEPSVRGDVMEAIPSLETVHFDFDSSTLGAEALAILAKNAQWLKDHEDALVQVAGHCDQRGTDAYNLALGQRRAKAVRDYYMSLGVEGRRVATISYGKEKPLCSEDTEDCWQKNRRGETLMALSKTDAQKTPSSPTATP